MPSDDVKLVYERLQGISNQLPYIIGLFEWFKFKYLILLLSYEVAKKVCKIVAEINKLLKIMKITLNSVKSRYFGFQTNTKDYMLVHTLTFK